MTEPRIGPANPPPPPARAAAPPAPAGGAVVLVVDGDAVSRRFVELALADEPRLSVECVATAAAALEVMRTTPCDLLVIETQLPDLDGLDLIRRLRGRGRGHELPIVVLSADDRVASKVAAFGSGVDDYLVKPCAPAELRARIARRVLGREERQARLAASPMLSGQLAAFALPDLVSVLALGRQTATVEIQTPRGDGALFFEAGRLVHAVYLSVAGARAFYQLFAEEHGRFILHDGCAALERTVHDSVTALIMEAARQLDTARATAAPPPPAPPPSPPVAEALPIGVQRTAPDRTLALGFTRDVTDGYTLASLRLLTVAELGAWSRRTTRGPRLQIAVIAPALLGAAAIASLSTAPGERELAAALDRDPRCLTAHVAGRDGRELDLVLIELTTGAVFARWLGRRPDLCVVAAPEDELGPLPASYRTLLGLLAPEAVVTVGAAAVHAPIAGELGPAVGPAVTHREADLARPGELRRAIAEGLRLWLRGTR